MLLCCPVIDLVPIDFEFCNAHRFVGKLLFASFSLFVVAFGAHLWCMGSFCAYVVMGFPLGRRTVSTSAFMMDCFE